MRNIARTLIALSAFIVLAQASASAEDLCIPLMACVSRGDGLNSGSGSESAPAKTLDISGNSVGIGMALIAGFAAMKPHRRRAGTATRITDR